MVLAGGQVLPHSFAHAPECSSALAKGWVGARVGMQVPLRMRKGLGEHTLAVAGGQALAHRFVHARKRVCASVRTCRGGHLPRRLSWSAVPKRLGTAAIGYQLMNPSSSLLPYYLSLIHI